MEKYICKIATLDEINSEWDKEIKNHPNDNRWSIWKKENVRDVQNGTRVCYYGILNGKIISKAIAVISDKDIGMQNKEGLIGNKTAYLTAFSTLSKYQGHGYFSKLYRFFENDLKSKGFNKLTIGVEPCEVKNMKIYFNWGFDNYIKTAHEIYPAELEGKEPQKIIVNFYYKNI